MLSKAYLLLRLLEVKTVQVGWLKSHVKVWWSRVAFCFDGFTRIKWTYIGMIKFSSCIHTETSLISTLDHMNEKFILCYTFMVK